MATATEPLLRSLDGGVLTLTLNRPETLNSLDGTLLAALRDAIAAATDESVRCVVLTGAGRGFSSGADLTEPDKPSDLERLLAERYHPVILGLRGLRKPVIASVNGVAAGAGLSLALACDLRIAARSARFIQAFVRIGLVPDAGSTYFLPRLVGPALAAELCLLGDTVDAERAERIGLVNAVVDDEALAERTAALAARLAAAPYSAGLIAQALRGATERSLEEQLRLEGGLQARASASADFVEGVTAFLEKRPARFSGR